MVEEQQQFNNLLNRTKYRTSVWVTLHFLQRNIVFLLFKPYRISFCNGPASATDQKLLWCSVKIALRCFGYDFSLADKGVGGGILDFQVSRHVEITVSITQKLCHRAAKVFILGKVSTLAFQKHQIIFKVKRLECLKYEICPTHVSLLETYLLPHLLKKLVQIWCGAFSGLPCPV